MENILGVEYLLFLKGGFFWGNCQIMKIMLHVRRRGGGSHKNSAELIKVLQKVTRVNQLVALRLKVGRQALVYP